MNSYCSMNIIFINLLSSQKLMKYNFMILGISLLLFIFTQTNLLYGISNDINATVSIDSIDQLEARDSDMEVNANNFTSSLKEMISEGKTTLLSVLDIKPNTTINHNTLACLYGKGDLLSEINCESLIVFGTNDFEAINSIDSKGPISFANVVTVVNEGIDKWVNACGQTYTETLSTNQTNTYIEKIDCNYLYIAYK